MIRRTIVAIVSLSFSLPCALSAQSNQPRTLLAFPSTSARAINAPTGSDGVRNPYTFHKHLALWSLAGAYATTVMTSAAMDDAFIGTTALPVVGPWITMARIESGAGYYTNGGKPLLAASGLLQGGLLIYALVSWAHESSFVPRVSVAPTVARPGITASIAF